MGAIPHFNKFVHDFSSATTCSCIDDVGSLLKVDGLLKRVSGSGEDGVFAYQGLAERGYTIEALKETDENDSDAVSVTDALSALKIAFGINQNGGPVSPYQYLAADVDENGPG